MTPTWAENGKVALQYMSKESFALVITDVEMPEMNGLALLKEIKSQHKTKRTPVIVLTTLDDQEVFNQAIDLEVDDFIVKPFKPMELELRINNILKRMTAELIVEKQLKAMDASVDGMAILNNEGKYVYSNTAHLEIFGFYNQDQILGSHIKSMYQHDQLERLEKEIMPEFLKKGYWRGELIAMRSDGTNYDQELSMTTIEGQNGFICICRDITKRKKDELRLKKYNSALEQARIKAMEASRAKTAFLANMSHEIRTPMNGVIGMTEMLRETNLDDDQKAMVEAIYDCGSSLVFIINDILDMSKVESKELEIELDCVEIRNLVNSIVHLFRSKFNEKKISLRCYYDDHLPQYLHLDRTRIRQILSNLINNAYKFTDTGSVEIFVKSDLFISDSLIQFEVKDSGIGISSDLTEKIFEPFKQADVSTTRIYGGTGLGLAICQSLVKLMGGKIWVDSEPGSGSTFAFTIETKEIVRKNREVLDEEASKEKVVNIIRDKSIDVLIAEDNEINQKIICSFLGKLKIKYELAKNGKQALEIAKKKKFDIIFMDIHMPVMDGVDATKKIRNLPINCQTPVVAMTASVTEGEQKKYREMGMSACLVKPIRINNIVSLIEEIGLIKEDSI